MPWERCHLLVVEDNPAEVRLIEKLLLASGHKTRVTVARDGEKAMEYLHRHVGAIGAGRPDLILLDLNLPKMSGSEVLVQIRAEQNLRNIPVVILTSSANPEDITRCYDQCVNSYITKPLEFSQYASVMETIMQFWMKTAQLPRRPHYA
ncbi:MAG: response regulator [Verrucomicrobia bacterium]|nr:response regulator [Verrucomicrobiota bacterium]MDA1086174.1 response regulator [Verrucomicrobiota bacterium]